jgi:hypothetical protein
MPLIIDISHSDYPVHSVCRDTKDIQSFLQKEKRFSLDEFKRRTSWEYCFDIINEYGCAKLFDLKGNCIGGIYPAETLCDIDTIRKEKQRDRDLFGIA